MILRKLIVSSLFLLVVGASATSVSADEGRQVHQLIGLLDYIGADYSRAVRGGKVVDEFEYKEMEELSAEAAKLVDADEDAPAELRSTIAEIRTSIAEKAPPKDVDALSRSAREIVVSHYDVALFPTRPPDRDRGAELYANECASCHGAHGAADVPIAEELKPAPADFTDPGLRAGLSPYRVFNTTTFGIEGTSMKAYGHLSERDRWSLAFYVMALAHGGPVEHAEQKSPLPEGVRPTLKLMATHTDSDLRTELEDAATDESLVGAGLTHLRTRAPFEIDADSALGVVKDRLDDAEAAWEGGDFSIAREHVLAAYLEGFEPVESQLSAVDSEMTGEIEGRFFALRDSLENEDAEAARGDLRILREELDEAEEMLVQETSSWALGVASATIALREGVEVVLLLALLLGLLGRTGREDAKKYVHGGWIAAVVAGVVTWFVASHFIEISGAGRELLEGIVALLAAMILFSVSYWFIGKLQGERWHQFIKEQIEAKASGGRLMSLAGISFLAVYREAFETVLFYQALILHAEGNIWPIFGGIGVAGVLLAAFTLALFKLEMKLPLKPFFALSAAALYGICIVLVGSGLHALVEAGWLSPMPVTFPKITWLGIYPETVGLVAQGALALAGVVWAVVLYLRTDDSDSSSGPKAAE